MNRPIASQNTQRERAVHLVVNGERHAALAEFDTPDVFDIERRAPRILSFGHGQHSCLGQHVARMEGQLSLAALLARFPDYELDLSDAERYQSEFIQGFSRLPLQVRA